MSFIKKLIKSIYDLRPMLFLRKEIKVRLQSAITHALELKTRDLDNRVHAVKAQTDAVIKKTDAITKQIIQQFDNQNKYLNNITLEDRDFHVGFRHMQAHADIKHDKQLFFLENIYTKQGFTAYFCFKNEFLGVFSSILKKIITNDYPNISKNIENIFSEILIGHMAPGRIWKLRQDINLFQTNDSPHSTEASVTSKTHTNNQPLKILIVSGTFPSLMHGGGNRLFDIILNLSKKHQVDLYTHYDQALDDTTLELIRAKVDNIKLVTYPELTHELIGAWLRSLNRGNNYYDVIQLEYPHTVRFIPNLKLYGKKVGFTFMESLAKSFTEKIEITLKNQNYGEISEICNNFWASIADEKFAIENADFTIAVTNNDYDFLQRISNKRPFVIPTCVSDYSIIEEGERLINEIQQEDKSVMFLGFFGHWPNIEAAEWYLSYIHPKVKAVIPEYKFYVVGSGDISRVKTLAEGDSTVVITGRVESVVPHILKAKICVSPLISGAGIRGKQNQYSILNRPSVTTTIGNKGLKYVHEESVMIADTHKEFADSIIRLLSEDNLYKKLQKNAKMIASENYTWDSYILQLIKIYRE